MKFQAIIILILLLVTFFTIGCMDDPFDDSDNITYDEYTNSEFYIQYPADWETTIENQDQGTDITFTAQPYQYGPYIYIRGEELDDLANGFDGWVDSTYETLQESDYATILSYNEAQNEAVIIFTEVGSNDVTYYKIYKFIVCASSVYLCTSIVENSLRDQYQEGIDYSTASLRCA